MKQKIYQTLLFFCACMVFISCYKDKGNYDVQPLQPITLQAKDTIFTTQFEKLEVKPQIDLNGLDEKDIEFSWRLWANTIGDTVVKQLGKGKDLSYIVNEVPGSYSLVLTGKNKKNDVKSYKTINLRVQGVISEGWMVLHEKNGKSDFDLIMSPFFTQRYNKDMILRNLYSSVNKEDLPGRGVQISSYFALGRYQNVVVLTENGGVKLSATTMQKTFDLSTLMFDKKPLKPQSYHYLSYYWALGKGSEVIVSDGRFYINELLGTGFTEPILPNGERYRASAYAPKWLWVFRNIIYDEIKGRFVSVQPPLLTLTPLPAANGRSFDWNNMKGTLKYMDTGFKKYDYGLIKDWSTGKETLYALNFDEKNNFDVGMWEAKDCPELANAKHYAIGERGNVFYYATDKDIYLYDYAGTNKASKLFSMPNEEVITQMKILKPTIDRHIPNHPYNNKVLIISTYNASKDEGKVKMYHVNESNGMVDLSSLKVFEGFGKIISMDYNFPKYGT